MNKLDVSVLLTKWIFRYMAILFVIASFWLAFLAPTIWWGIACVLSFGIVTISIVIQAFLDD